MWITRSILESQRLDNVKAQEEARVLATQNKVLQTNMDWMRLRITQLEKERAQMVYQLMGIKTEVPELHTQEVKLSIPDDISHPLNQLPSFNDVGDDEAKRLGL